MVSFWFLLAIVGVVYSTEDSTTITTASTPTTSSAELECNCLACEDNNAFFTKHTQNVICESDAVLQGRVTSRKTYNVSRGLWNSEKHKEMYPLHYFTDHHHELSVRVLQVYSNRGPVKVKIDEKINIRYASLPDCHACETLVEDFNDETYVDRAITQGDKYVFFLPTLQHGFGEKNRTEAVIRQCDKVWRYKKRGAVDTPGQIPLIQRYVLTATKCDKCRVSGCFQNKCVKADEFEECDRLIWPHEWMQNACLPLMDNGLCYYSSRSDSCKWTSVTEEGYRSLKPIEECLPLE